MSVDEKSSAYNKCTISRRILAVTEEPRGVWKRGESLRTLKRRIEEGQKELLISKKSPYNKRTMNPALQAF
jgi:hypothetical protein